jgi:hypothetical protein
LKQYINSAILFLIIDFLVIFTLGCYNKFDKIIHVLNVSLNFNMTVCFIIYFLTAPSQLRKHTDHNIYSLNNKFDFLLPLL